MNSGCGPVVPLSTTVLGVLLNTRINKTSGQGHSQAHASFIHSSAPFIRRLGGHAFNEVVTSRVTAPGERAAGRSGRVSGDWGRPTNRSLCAAVRVGRPRRRLSSVIRHQAVISHQPIRPGPLPDPGRVCSGHVNPFGGACCAAVRRRISRTLTSPAGGGTLGDARRRSAALLAVSPGPALSLPAGPMTLAGGQCEGDGTVSGSCRQSAARPSRRTIRTSLTPGPSRRTIRTSLTPGRRVSRSGMSGTSAVQVLFWLGGVPPEGLSGCHDWSLVNGQTSRWEWGRLGRLQPSGAGVLLETFRPAGVTPAYPAPRSSADSRGLSPSSDWS